METLSSRQCAFAGKLAQLIQKGIELGFAVKICTLWRTEAQQADYIARGLSKTKNSMHLVGLAADLALFRNDVLSTAEDDFRALGEYWELLGGRWGGRFGVDPGNYATKIGWDVDHFEIHNV